MDILEMLKWGRIMEEYLLRHWKPGKKFFLNGVNRNLKKKKEKKPNREKKKSIDLFFYTKRQQSSGKLIHYPTPAPLE